jgi:hypothetical protein
MAIGGSTSDGLVAGGREQQAKQSQADRDRCGEPPNLRPDHRSTAPVPNGEPECRDEIGGRIREEGPPEDLVSRRRHPRDPERVRERLDPAECQRAGSQRVGHRHERDEDQEGVFEASLPRGCRPVGEPADKQRSADQDRQRGEQVREDGDRGSGQRQLAGLPVDDDRDRSKDQAETADDADAETDPPDAFGGTTIDDQRADAREGEHR